MKQITGDFIDRVSKWTKAGRNFLNDRMPFEIIHGPDVDQLPIRTRIPIVKK